MFLSKKAQSTLEYIVIFTAITAVIVWAANSFINPAVRTGIETHATQVVQNAAVAF